MNKGYLKEMAMICRTVVLVLFVLMALNACTVDEITIPQLDLSTIIPKTEPKPEVSILDTYSPGELLHCKIGIGSIKVGKEWMDFKDKSFVIIKNGRSNVNLQTKKGGQHMAMQTIFDDPGQKLLFCPLEPDPKKVVNCMSLYFVDKDLDYGIKRAVNIKDFMQGGVVSCAYEEENVKTLAVPR